MRESVVNIAVDMLNMNRGEVDVMPYLRSKCTIASLSSTISRVRSSWIKKTAYSKFRGRHIGSVYYDRARCV